MILEWYEWKLQIACFEKMTRVVNILQASRTSLRMKDTVVGAGKQEDLAWVRLRAREQRFVW